MTRQRWTIVHDAGAKRARVFGTSPQGIPPGGAVDVIPVAELEVIAAEFDDLAERALLPQMRDGYRMAAALVRERLGAAG